MKVAPHLATIETIDDLAVSSAATTCAMLARDSSARRLVIDGDALVAIPRGRVGAMSPPETELRLDLVDAGLPEPSLDVEIRGHDGRLPGITELVYPQQRIAVEVEGDHHRTSRDQWGRDLEKYADYAAAGWEVVRLTVPQIRAGRAVGVVAAALERRSS